MARKPRRADGESGQMMLLAAFVFVIALLAMSAMISRVPLLAKQSSQEQDRAILQEISPLVAGLDQALESLAVDFRPALDGTASASNAPGGNGTAFDEAVANLLQQMRLQSASRGLILEWRSDCPSNGGTTTLALTLTDGDMRIDVQSAVIRCHTVGLTGSWTDAQPLPPPPPPTLVCAPASQTVAVSQAAAFTAAGGTGTYSWLSTGSIAPTSGSGAAYAAAYATTGTRNVTLTSGTQARTCMVVVIDGVVCSPGTQAVAIGLPASFTAAGGSGTYTWASVGSDAPDTGSGAAYSATYSTAGTYDVEATDGTYTGTCEVAVEPPVECTPAAQDVGVGQDAAFAATGGSGAFSWSSPGSDAPTSGTGSTYTARYSTVDNYTVTVTAGTGAGTCSVTVTDALTCAPGSQAVGPGQAADFTAAGGTGTYSWDSAGSEDPTTGSGATYSATYAGTGLYTVTLTSGPDTDTCDVTVDPLLACAPATQTVGVGQAASFTASGGGATLTWASPGSDAPTSGSGAGYSATYSTTGTKTVTLTSGTQTDTCDVTVEPALTCSPASQTVGVGGVASFAGAGGAGTLSWESPGSEAPTSGSGATYTATYATTGSKTVTVTSGPQTADCAVTVEDALVCSPASQSVATNTPASLAASGGTGAYSWSSPSGTPTSGSGSPYSVSYPGLGSYTVTLSSTYQTTTCTVSVSLYYTYASDCEAKTGTVASCPANLGAADPAVGTLTEGTTTAAASDAKHGTTTTKVSGSFTATGHACQSSGADTSGNAKGAPDGVWACYEQKNDKLSVGGFSSGGHWGRITKVEVAVKAKVMLDSGGAVTSNQVRLLYKLSGTQGATTADYTLSTSDSTNYLDVTADRTWAWGDLANLAVQADAQTANGNKEHLNVDALWVRVTADGLDTRLGFTATGVPSATTQTLELAYATTGDTYRVQLWDGAAWNSRGAVLSSASQTTWSYVLTAAEYQAGYPRARIVDVSSGVAAPAGTVLLDYVRVASS